MCPAIAVVRSNLLVWLRSTQVEVYRVFVRVSDPADTRTRHVCSYISPFTGSRYQVRCPRNASSHCPGSVRGWRTRRSLFSGDHSCQGVGTSFSLVVRPRYQRPPRTGTVSRITALASVRLSGLSLPGSVPGRACARWGSAHRRPCSSSKQHTTRTESAPSLVATCSSVNRTLVMPRSEERRVGKECRSRGTPSEYKKNEM